MSFNAKFPPATLVLAVASTILVPVLPAHAQLEEIIVTAQKREEGSQKTPLSITALGADDILQRGIANSGDLMKEIPGVGGFESPGSKGAVGLSMRGVAGGAPANLSLDPVIALYLDGVYIGKQVGSAMDVAEIERVEVLRGPQGTLYGRNSTGGAVNIITRRPTGEFGVRTIGTIGKYNQHDFKLNMDLPAFGTVGEGLGELAVSFGYQTRNRDGFYSNTVADEPDFNEIDREAWRAAITWRPTETFVADYTYDKGKLDETHTLEQVVGFTPLDAAGTVSRIAAMQGVLQGAQAWASTPGTDPRISSRLIPSLQKTIATYQSIEARGEGRAGRGQADHMPFSENDVEGHALTLTWEAGELGVLGDVTFKSITAQRDLETFVFGDLEDINSRLDANGAGSMNDVTLLTLGQLYAPSSGFSHPLVDTFWEFVDSIGAFHSKQDTFTEYKQFSQELQMNGSTERVDYALGLYYFEDEGFYTRNSIFLAPLAGGAPSQVYSNDTEAMALYGQATWTPGLLEDRLSFTTGLRYTEEDKGIDYNYGEVVSPFAVTPARAVSRNESFYNVSGNFTVAMQWTPDINSFLRYSTGYRSGGFNGEIFDNPYEEETVEQWEVGIKSDWWDRRLRVNGSLWTYIWEDVQVGQIKTDSGTATTQITNAGEAERWGGELEILLAPIDDLILGLNYSYINGDFDKFPELCGTSAPVTCLNSVDFARRGSSPSNALSATADYVFVRTSIGDVRGYLQINWQDEWYEASFWGGVVGGQPVILDHQVMDARTLVNARLSLENIPLGDRGNLRISLWGKNLTDDDYPTFSINFGQLGVVTEQYGDPRTYGLEVAYEY